MIGRRTIGEGRDENTMKENASARDKLLNVISSLSHEGATHMTHPKRVEVLAKQRRARSWGVCGDVVILWEFLISFLMLH